MQLSICLSRFYSNLGTVHRVPDDYCFVLSSNLVSCWTSFSASDVYPTCVRRIYQTPAIAPITKPNKQPIMPNMSHNGRDIRWGENVCAGTVCIEELVAASTTTGSSTPF